MFILVASPLVSRRGLKAHEKLTTLYYRQLSLDKYFEWKPLLKCKYIYLEYPHSIYILTAIISHKMLKFKCKLLWRGSSQCLCLLFKLKYLNTFSLIQDWPSLKMSGGNFLSYFLFVHHIYRVACKKTLNF